MKKRSLSLLILLGLLLGLSVAPSSWGQEWSELYVVRASNNTLWRMVCYYGSCTTWAQITGQFAQQPTLIWDGAWGRYVLTGVSTANTIWRSTFDINGNHLNDWVSVPGSTPSPVAAAGGPIVIGWAKMYADGTISDCFNCNPGDTYRVSTGQYQVGFNFYLPGTPRTATLDTQGIGIVIGEIGVADRSGDYYALWVNTSDSTGAWADLPFTVILYNH